MITAIDLFRSLLPVVSKNPTAPVLIEVGECAMACPERIKVLETDEGITVLLTDVPTESEAAA